MARDHSKYVARVGLLFAVYFITARLGLGLDAVSGFATLVWPPTGIALAAMLIWGYRYWPGIFIGAALVNLATGAPLLVALGIATGNTLEALLGAYLLNRSKNFNFSLEKLAGVLNLVVYAAIISTLISATIGVTTLFLDAIVPSALYGEAWTAWWVGDMLGALVVTPLILVWYTRLQRPLGLLRVTKAILPTICLIGVSIVAFFGLPLLEYEPFTFTFAVYPILIWIALRFNQLGSVSAVFIVSVIAIWGTISNSVPTTDDSLSDDLLVLQSFIGVTAVTFMVLAAVVSEKEITQNRQQYLQHRTALLTKQRSRLRALSKAKDEFISIASHQLRTPATGVKQYLGLLRENYAGRLSKKQLRYVETAYESNERELKTIDDILRITRLNANRLQLNKTDCDINLLIADVVNHRSKIIEKRRQKILFEPNKKLPQVRIDRELIGMVIENIIDNASKYSPDAEDIKISVSKSDKYIHLKIQDNGIGIAKKDLKKLFQKFSRIDNANTINVDGLGLGLYWANKVINLHGGTITVESQLNKGATFIVNIPLEPSKKPVRR